MAESESRIGVMIGAKGFSKGSYSKQYRDFRGERGELELDSETIYTYGVKTDY